MGSKRKKRMGTGGAGAGARPSAASTVDPRRDWLQAKRVAWLLGVVTLAVYLRVAGHAFLSYDDAVYVTDNVRVLRGLAPSSIWWAFTATEGSNYWHPLTWLSHMLDVDLYGLRAGGHHFTSALLHAVNTGVLFLVLWALWGATVETGNSKLGTGNSKLETGARMWGAAVVAGLFGLHPLHVESVAWVAERKDVLSGLFWILAIGAYGRYVQWKLETGNGKRGEEKARAQAAQVSRSPFQVTRWYLTSLVCFLFALMSKPMAVTLPFVLLLLDWWPLKRMANAAFGVRNVSRLILEKLPFFLLAGVVSIWVYRTQELGGALAAGGGIPLDYRVANALLSYVAYLGQTVWPAKLAFFYPHPEADLSFWAAGGAGVLLAVVTGVAVWQRARRPWLLVGWLWYVVTLLPVIGLIQVGSFARADRYTYLPLIGIFWMVAGGWRGEAGNWKLETGNKGLGKVADARGAPLSLQFQVSSVVLLAVLAVLTWRQIGFWKDGITLATHALRVTEDNTMAMNCLGEELLLAGRRDEAMVQFQRALAINPNLAPSHFNLGLALLNAGRNEDAMPHFLAALKADPSVRKAHYNVGVYLAGQGRWPEAAAHYRAELQVNPGFARAHNNLGNVLVQQGDHAGAAAAYWEALRLDPGLVEAYANLGVALQNQGKGSEAIAAYSEALRRDPEQGRVQGQLGGLLARAGQRDLARAHLAEALRLDADDATVRFTLGNLQAEAGEVADAVRNFEEAARLDPQGADALINLAWIRATSPEASQRDGAEALRLARQALERAGTNDPPSLDALAAAYAEAGDFTQAVAVAEQVVALAAAGGAGNTASDVAQRLAHYRQGKPFRSTRPLLQ